ncbi:hypothetical protein SAMN05428947_114156 [Mucilaginibacter sp. OK283]|nr:hypothetical protein SAMN05428947_114156 [Mucilaginibacter sp. OK283]
MIYHDIFQDTPEAINCFQKAVEISPRFTIAKLNLGFALRKFPDKYDEAAAIYKDILSYDPYESTLFGIYKRESVDIDKLILFSRLLNKNLFLYYLNEEPLKSMFSKDMVTLQNRILELETELSSKGEKLKDLTDIIETQKKVISLYEANVSNKAGGRNKRSR